MTDDMWPWEERPIATPDRVDVTPTSPPVDWTPGDVETALREARGRLARAAGVGDIQAAEAAMAQWRKLAFRRGDEKVETET